MSREPTYPHGFHPCLGGGSMQNHKHIHSDGSQCHCNDQPDECARGEMKAIDPVCGMEVDPHRSKHIADFQGETYHFCSNRCRERFVAAPEQYLASLNHKPAQHPPSGSDPRLAKDPVCGMDVDPHTAKHRAEYAGHTYYFCSARCRERFVSEPAKYLAPQAAKVQPVSEGTIYTCPMHPEIRQVGPGTCPICGMALEPLMVTAEAGANPECAAMMRRPARE